MVSQVFDPEMALKQCCDMPDVLQEMIASFLDNVDNLFSQMRAALKKGDLVEVGRLGHQTKGAVLFIGTESVKKAALRVERFGTSNDGTPSKVEEAIDALEQECLALKTALIAHPLTAELENMKKAGLFQ
ncbi:MAG: Hpt domain-containing protein [Planctomycetota bacterium]